MTTTIFDAYSTIMAKKPKFHHQILEFRCTNCKSRLAAIFEDDGDYCVHCWQEQKQSPK